MVSLNYNSLASFIEEDNLPGLKALVEKRNVCIDERNENGSTALQLAAAQGRLNFVRELLNNGADPNIEDNDKWTPLIAAAKEGHTLVCAELCDHGAVLEHQDMGGWTALMWACYKGKTDVAKLLMERGSNVNTHGLFYISPLMWAAGRGHELIVRDLLDHGAKVNVADKHGTTALIWACRKGYTAIVDMLLQSGANAEVSGMHCWTPLLVATRGNYVEIVQKLLEKRPNVNVVDKDGSTALMLACKEGYYEICVALLNAGAYVNLQDRSGDTNLIHAAKAGHRSIVEALLKKYADVDMAGKERKTALYWAVEKNHLSVVKALLSADPNLEIATKDGDTPLLRAVRNRNVELVQLLLDKKARVSVADKEGDTALHIAMRARSKAIVEVLLRNPKNSQLLYRPNRAGETPYNIDTAQQKTILGQIFGARRLNTNEDNENMLGYDLYSSALADILSEPSLSMPITVGLYAKWGSGKSFLLNKLREEMKGFARQWTEPTFEFSLVLSLIILHCAALVGIVVGVSLDPSVGWICGLAVAAGVFALSHTFLYIVQWGSTRCTWSWAYKVSLALAKRLASIKLVLQVTFCTPPGPQWGGDNIKIQPIRFYFTDQTKVSRSASGQNSVVQMIGSLLNSIEADYGTVATRLYRAFRPKPLKVDSPWRLRRFCCFPYAVLFVVCLDVLLAGLVLLVCYLQGDEEALELSDTLRTVLITIGVVVGVVMIANVYTWTRVVQSLLVSQRRKLQRSVSRIHSVKAEGYLQALKREVAIMVEMVRCLDAFSGQQTRLVMVVDGLDSCEQDQVLYVLDAVHLLFTEQGTPFITVLAIDPHIIMKAIELNLHRMFNESNIGGHDYLRNLVHLPFYLQNAGLRKVKSAQQAAVTARTGRPLAPTSTTNAVLNWLESEDNTTNQAQSVSPRRMSTESTSAAVKGLSRLVKNPGSLYGGGRKLRASESMESGIGPATGANRVQAAQDLTKVLLTDDYFSDVNPRSMRRLMNVIYVTGRLLKAFQIEFNWYHLASWVNISEQWPYRTSWMILYCDIFEEKLDDFTSLKTIYDRVKPFIPVSKDVEPLLEMDRDEKKLEIFLGFHRNNLQVLHMKIFLPFTIHLDPYLRKVIKEERTGYAAMEAGLPSNKTNNKSNPANARPAGSSTIPTWGPAPWTTVTLPTPDQAQTFGKFTLLGNPNYGMVPTMPYVQPIVPAPLKTTLPARFNEKLLSSMSVEEICDLIRSLEGVRTAAADVYAKTIAENNISGRVLVYCDLDELKKILAMSFGDWELFRVAINVLREREYSAQPRQSPIHGQTGSAATAQQPTNLLDVDYADQGRMSRSSSMRSAVAPSASEPPAEYEGSQSAPKYSKRQNLIEKQVTLEEQAICGALQTLNEEALEDVLDEREAEIAAEAPILSSCHSSNLSSCSDASEMDVLYLQTSVVPEMPISNLAASSLALGSLGRLGREDSVSLTSSLASLAERGSVTPARQRTVTEVVWPENVSALSSGLRSRLGSSTSLFRAGSQKSVIDGAFALVRKSSQRSVGESNASVKPPLAATLSAATQFTGGQKSEQGSPRRPVSLVLTDPINSRVEWPASVASAERSRSNSQSSTPTASPPVAVTQPRFTTTAVEMNADNSMSKTEKGVTLKSPPKHRKRRPGISQRQGSVNVKLEAKRSPQDQSSDEESEGEDVPLMSPKHAAKISMVSVAGSSTSSIDSPLDTTDNEVYKTVIPKSDSSRREHSLANILKMPLENDLVAKTDTGPETPV